MAEDTAEGFDSSADGPSIIDVAVPAYIAITNPKAMLTTVDMSTHTVALLVIIYGDGSRAHVPIPRHM